MREYPRGPEDVPFMRQKKSLEALPKGMVEEIFGLDGFFQTTEFISRRVGKSFFRIPSTREIAHQHAFFHRSDNLKWDDKDLGTDHVRSVMNIINWIDKGNAALDEAQRYEAGESQHFAMNRHLETARDAFRKAQHISRVMQKRYYPHLHKKD